jgi:6-phosphogluconolactonase
MAEIAVHPSVKFRYASNRGHNSLVGYRIDPSTGLLSVIGFATQGVNFPRKFVIDPESEVAIRRQPEGRHHRAVRD